MPSPPPPPPHASRLAPHLFVILGGTGDLTGRKLLPALARLHCHGALPAESAVLGAALPRELDDAAYRRWGREALGRAGIDAGAGWHEDRLFYQSLGGGRPDDYRVLARRIAEIEAARGLPGNRVFYLALPPAAVPGTLQGLAAAGLTKGPGWTRIVAEKPFGFDLDSARTLDERLHEHFVEEQIYRIDHYLGKETVQNLLAFRFANGIFESLWNRDRVDNVQITVSEELGVEGRAGYYDGVGAVRDMMQNHLLQLLALVTMEVPVGFNPAAVRYEKTKALTSIAPIRPEHLVLGQYGRGTIDGAAVPAYRDEPGIAAGSRTPTFAAVRLELESWRWKGVPFYLRTGKRLARKLSRISIVFRDPPVHLFGPLSGHTMPPNVFDLTIQPDEGMSLSFQVKAPGQAFDLVGQRLDFGYARAFGPIADAYETLLYDVVEGDQTYFVSSEAIDVGWRLYTPLLRQELPVHEYAAGSWGPDASAALLARDGRSWRPEGAGPVAAPQARAGAELPSRVEST